MKKVVALMMTLIMVLGLCGNVFADNDINVTVNGSAVQFDVKPFIDTSNRTLIPVRFVSEKLGASVGWNGNTQTVTVDLDEKHITLTIDQKEISVNGNKQTMDTQAIIKESRTFVPVRFVAEALGANVDWIDASRTVVITTDGDSLAVELPEGLVTNKVEMNKLFNQYEDEVPEGVKIDKMVLSDGKKYSFYLKENNGTKAIVTQNEELNAMIDLLKNGKKIEGTPNIYSPRNGETYHTFTVNITIIDSFAIYDFDNDTMTIVPNPFRK